MAGLVVGKAFFEVVDAVIFGVGVGEAADSVEVVALETVFGGVFDHVPLDEVLGVVFFHVFFIATREKIDNFVAVEEKHGGAEGDGARSTSFRRPRLAVVKITTVSRTLAEISSFGLEFVTVVILTAGACGMSQTGIF